MKPPQSCSQTQQTSRRAAQPCRLTAAFFQERIGPRRLGAPRCAREREARDPTTLYHYSTPPPLVVLKLDVTSEKYQPTNPSAASTATDATSPSAGPSAIISPKNTNHFARPFLSDDANFLTRFTSTKPDTA